MLLQPLHISFSDFICSAWFEEVYDSFDYFKTSIVRHSLELKTAVVQVAYGTQSEKEYIFFII